MPRKRKSLPLTTWRRAITQYIADHPDRPLKPRMLSRELGIIEEDYAEFRSLIRQLLADGSLAYGRGRTLTLPERAGTLVGVFRARRRGFGLIESPGCPDAFVPHGRRRGARDGDSVIGRLLKPRRPGAEPRAEVVRIVERAPIRWVGVLERLGARWIVRPFGRTPAPVVTVANPTAQRARCGDMVVVEPLEQTFDTRSVRGAIVERLGDPESTPTKIRAVIRRYGLPDGFSAEVKTTAERAGAAFGASDLADREDLRTLLTITIDPPDARDFDDAISLRPLRQGRCELGVHIADVAHFVRADDPLDVEARARGTSVYFPGCVLPMLPERLSNDTCSLRSGEPRLTKSVFITYDEQARVVATRFANAVICSRAALTYEQVTAVLAGQRKGVEPAVARLLRTAAQLARRIRARRAAEGMIELTSPEVEIRLDAEGNVVDAGPADMSFSHKIIEMFMVEANEAVCRLLTRAGVPHVRRIHPKPEPEAMQRFAGVSAALGLPKPHGLDRASIRAALDSVRGQPAEPAVNFLLLRCMSQACYSPSREGHFALASEHYCHFTSPIRRYPDLVVHRLLDSHLRGKLRRTKRQREAGLIPAFELAEIGRSASAAERRAQGAEREAKTALLLGLMRSRVGEALDGIIIGVASFGAFVQVCPFAAEGLVRVADFGPGKWHFDRQGEQSVGGRSRRVVRIGQAVRVVVAAVDERRLEMVLVPAEGVSLGKSV
jgi:ribonuclease R